MNLARRPGDGFPVAGKRKRVLYSKDENGYHHWLRSVQRMGVRDCRVDMGGGPSRRVNPAMALHQRIHVDPKTCRIQIKNTAASALE